MTTAAELERIAERTVWPSSATEVVGVVDVKPGGRLPNGSPSGIGVETRYGAAFFDGLRRSPAIAFFERRTDADRLIRILKDGSTLRSGPRSVAALTAGPAEGGSVPSVQPGRSSVPSSRGRSSTATRRPDGAPMPQGAGSPGAPSSEAAQRPSDAVEAKPAGVRCKACGRSLEGLPPSRNGQRRQTCNDACRQAFRRGHRAPVPGVVGPEVVESLSRSPDRFLSGFGHGDPEPAPDANQLAMSLGHTPAS